MNKRRAEESAPDDEHERFHCPVPDEEHTCPYAAEINDDYEPCTCCEVCMRECLWDI